MLKYTRIYKICHRQGSVNWKVCSTASLHCGVGAVVARIDARECMLRSALPQQL